MKQTGFMAGVRRELNRMCARKMYIVGMVLIPITVVLFFVSLIGEGLPQEIPTAIVDLDHSEMSRQVTRTINTQQLVDARADAESFTAAMDMVRRGEIYGFFVIPANFQSDALGGRTPTLEYYTNMTYFVPGTLAFKGLKTVAVTTSAGMVRNTLISLGADPEGVAAMIQPVVIDLNPLNNPWLNYSYYMSPSFSMATFVLMMMLMTIFAIVGEIKQGTSRNWLETCGNRMSTALLSKMLPHTVLYCFVGLCILGIYFGWRHFPLNGSFWWMLFATFLLIIASQSFALFICCLLPNPRMAYSVAALYGVLTYSFAGFSLPVQSMYGAIAIFSYTAPMRYWYLFFINNALNGVDIWYSRWLLAALAVFPLLGIVLCGRLKKALLNPVYVP